MPAKPLSPKTILFVLISLIALSASVLAVRQQFLLQQLRQSIAACRQETVATQTRVARLEDNLRSTGQQMSNLSAIIQEATERAARCEAAQPD